MYVGMNYIHIQNPRNSVISNFSDIFTDDSDNSNTSDISGTSDVSEVPELSEISEVPELSEISELPEVSENRICRNYRKYYRNCRNFQISGQWS